MLLEAPRDDSSSAARVDLAIDRVLSSFDRDASGDLDLDEWREFVGRAARLVSASAWPPTIVLHARDDRTVPVTSARDFVAALKGVAPADGEAPSYHEYEAAGHGEIMIALMSRAEADALPAIAQDFVRACGMRA